MAILKTPIKSVAELGLLVRATRRASQLRLDDLAGCAQVGHVFVRDVEHGKETVQLGRVLRLLDELGIRLEADVPASVQAEFNALKATGLRPLKPRRSQPARRTGAQAPTLRSKVLTA